MSSKCQCQVTDIIYKCTVLSPDKPNKIYLRTDEGYFKKRLYNHRKLFINETSTNDSSFSKCIWELKETLKIKPNPSMVHCQKNIALLKYIQKV